MSDFKFPCPKCGQAIVCDVSNAGMSIPCPACNNPLTVPKPPAAAPVAAGGKLAIKKTEPSHAPAPTVAHQPQGTSWANRPVAAVAQKKASKNWAKPLITIAVLAIIAAIGWFGFAAPMLKEKAAKEQAEKDAIARVEADRKKAEADAEAERRARAVWTLDLAVAKLVNKPASGKLHGVNFTMESASLQKGVLSLRQETGSVRQFAMSIPLKPGESLPGKSFEVTTTESNHIPQIVMSWKDDAAKPPSIQRHKSGYALKLEFGQPADSKLPGKIFLALPDTEQSFVSGTFHVDFASTQGAAPSGNPDPRSTGKRPN